MPEGILGAAALWGLGAFIVLTILANAYLLRESTNKKHDNKRIEIPESALHDTGSGTLYLEWTVPDE
jgi:hypothetical protein